MKPFLKWAGGKTRVMPELLKHLPDAECLIEPFCGSGAVFMNTDYPEYVLCDLNPDLINTLEIAALYPNALISYTRELFNEGKTRERYDQIRAGFNDSFRFGDYTPFGNETLRIIHAAKFLYLNRHAYNGLCRYNQRLQFNVPFGDYSNPYFPEEEILAFAEKYRKAAYVRFVGCQFYSSLPIYAEAYQDHSVVIYADPPYLPTSRTANFTAYAGSPFGETEHQKLAELLLRAAEEYDAHVVLSNSDTPATRRIYNRFTMHPIHVQRSVGATSRERAKEVIGHLKRCAGCSSVLGGQCPDCGPAMGDATYQAMFGDSVTQEDT